MRKLIKEISLESFKTRLPITYPSISNGKVVYINSETLATLKNANYGNIPLGISEDITGKYSSFTTDMADAYSGKIIPYADLKDWRKEFCDYYTLLYSTPCHGPYVSAVEYYESCVKAKTSVLYQEYKDIDISFKKHGGKKFYQWLNDNYFMLIDLKKEVFDSIEDGSIANADIPKWVGYIEEWDSPILTYVEAKEWLGSIKDSTNSEYISMGGDDMFNLLKSCISNREDNIKNINRKVLAHENELIPNISVTFSIQNRIEDLGSEKSIINEYSSSEKYKNGSVVVYNGKTYIYSGGTEGDNEILDFDASKWIDYTEFCSQNEGFDKDVNLSGVTDSYLLGFKRDSLLVDDLGNELPGYYEAPDYSIYAQPSEGTLLDLNYIPGTTYDVKMISGSTTSNALFQGNILFEIDFYYKDSTGNVINNIIKKCNENDSPISTIKSLNDSIGEDINGVLMADFVYYIGAVFMTENNNIILADDYPNIKYIDHCTLILDDCDYFLNNKEHYPLKYYKIVNSEGTIYSDSNKTSINATQSDFYYSPNKNITSKSMAFQGYRSETELGFSSLENFTNNIYIDRGYATALDQHLKMGDIKSFDGLEKYGNGAFNIITVDNQ